MKKPLQPAIIIVLVLLLIMMLFKLNTLKSISETNYGALTDTVNHFTNRLGTQTASIATLQLANNSLKRNLTEKDVQLKALTREFNSVKYLTATTSVTKFDTIRTAFADTVPCAFSTSGSIRHKWYSMNFRADSSGLILHDVIIPDTTVIVTGTKRKWFLGRDRIVTEVTHTNPYVITTGIKSAETIVATPWYRRWYLWLLAGIAGGVLLK